MPNRVIPATLTALFCVTIASAQSAADIKNAYGPPVNAFSVSEHIWMTPEYAADGQICRGTLYAKRISPETDYVSNNLPLMELIGSVDKLAPVNMRGTRREPFGATQTSAALAWTIFTYENVTVSFWVSFRFGSLADMQAKGVPVGGRNPSPLITQTDAEYMAQNVINPEMVRITWNTRKCAK
jgi:hypothetical protein